MGVKAAPSKAIPDGDVKLSGASSVPAEEPEVKAAPAAETEPEPELGEDDLKEFSESSKIPYNRFKAVNDEKKELQSQIESFKQTYQDDMRRAVQDAEIRLKSQYEKQREDEDLSLSLDPYEKENREMRNQLQTLQSTIGQLQGETQRSRLETQINSLKQKYPKADDLAVMGWLKTKPNANVEDMMELSHVRNVKNVEVALRDLLEKKKVRATKAIPVREGRISLKPEERPKTLEEAKRAAMSYFRK